MLARGLRHELDYLQNDGASAQATDDANKKQRRNMHPHSEPERCKANQAHERAERVKRAVDAARAAATQGWLREGGGESSPCFSNVHSSPTNHNSDSTASQEGE